MNIHFDHAWILYLIWLVPLLGYWWLSIRKKVELNLAKLVAPQLQDKLMPARHGRQRQALQIGLVSAALALLMIAAAGPKWGQREETVYQQARDLVIAVDVSRSMLANDVHPSRLARAKIDLVDLIKDLKGDRAALIAFRAKARLVCPLTTDYAYLRQALDGLSPESAPRGATDIGDAISKALDTFNDDDSSHKAIILVSDGEDLSGRAIKLAQKAGKMHIPIFTVGIGSRQGAKIPDDAGSERYLKYKNKDIVTKLNNDTLYKIAEASGGAYIPIETAGMTGTTLGTIYNDHLRKIAARELAETRKTRAVERYQWFLLPAILLLLGTGALSRGRIKARKNTPKSKAVTAAAAAAIVLLPTAWTQAQTNSALPAADTQLAGQSSATNTVEAALQSATGDIPPGRRGARYAQKMYRKGKYIEAAAAYQAAAANVDRETARTFRHNAALALIKAGKYEQAADILRGLTLQSTAEDRNENDALGVAVYHAAESLTATNAPQLALQAELLQESAEAFKDAWRNNSDDSLSRDNIAVIIPKIQKAKEQSKILRLNAQYAKTPAPQLADKMLRSQRELCKKIPAAITNATPQRIRMLESLAAEQNRIADMWIPLTGKMREAMQQQGSASNAQHFASLNQLMEQAADKMQEGANRLRDLDPEGFRSAKVAEYETYQLWKTVAPYRSLLDEDLLQQTNAIQLVKGTLKQDAYNDPVAIQQETARLTELFKKKFEKEVPPEGIQPQQAGPQGQQAMPPPAGGQAGPTVANLQQMQGGTNSLQGAEGGLSATNRAKIVELATETITLQQDAAKLLTEKQQDRSLAKQEKSYRNLLEIKKLLPKDKNKNQCNKCKNPQQNKQQKKKQKKQKQKNKDKQKQKQKQDQQKQDQQKQKQQQKKKSAKQKKEDRQLKNVQKMLQKALEREKEHKEEKQKRRNRIPLPPYERDW